MLEGDSKRQFVIRRRERIKRYEKDLPFIGGNPYVISEIVTRRHNRHTGLGHSVDWKRPPRQRSIVARSHNKTDMVEAVWEINMQIVKPPRTRRFKMV